MTKEELMEALGPFGSSDRVGVGPLVRDIAGAVRVPELGAVMLVLGELTPEQALVEHYGKKLRSDTKRYRGWRSWWPWAVGFVVGFMMWVLLARGQPTQPDHIGASATTEIPKLLEKMKKDRIAAVQANIKGMTVEETREFVKLRSEQVAGDSNLGKRIYTVEIELKDLIQLYNNSEGGINTRILTETVEVLKGVVSREKDASDKRKQFDEEAAQTRHDTWVWIRGVSYTAFGAIIAWILKWWKFDPSKTGLVSKIDEHATERDAVLIGKVHETVHEAAVATLKPLTNDIEIVKERTKAWSGQQP